MDFAISRLRSVEIITNLPSAPRSLVLSQVNVGTVRARNQPDHSRVAVPFQPEMELNLSNTTLNPPYTKDSMKEIGWKQLLFRLWYALVKLLTLVALL